MRLVLGEPPADDLMAYLEQVRRTEGMMRLMRDMLSSAVTEGIAKSFGEK